MKITNSLNTEQIERRFLRVQREKSKFLESTSQVASNTRAEKRRFYSTNSAHPSQNSYDKEKLNQKLFEAASKENIEKLERLLRKGADCNAVDKQGKTLMHIACLRKSKEVVKFLLARGALFDQKDNYGLYPVDFVSHVVYADIIELLADAGLKAKPVDGDIQESLRKAVFCRDVDSARMYLESGAQVKEFREPLLLFAAAFKDPKMAELLLEFGADINVRDPIKDTSYPRASALHNASSRGNIDTMRVLINHGADIHAHCVGGTTPLQFAVMKGEILAAKELLGVGADINLGQKNFTPLFSAVSRACAFKNYEMLEFLLENGADPNYPTEAWSPLWQAVSDRKGDFKAVKMLVEAGADLNAIHYSLGTSPLARALEHGNLEIADYLRGMGAKDIRLRKA